MIECPLHCKVFFKIIQTEEIIPLNDNLTRRTFYRIVEIFQYLTESVYEGKASAILFFARSHIQPTIE